jgi:hypothetical protein
MDPRRTPEKVLMGHPCDQMATSLETLGRPPRQRPGERYLQTRGPATTAPAQDGFGLDDQQTFAPLRPPARQQDPKRPVLTTEVRATSSAALQYRGLMAQRDRFPTGAQCGFGVRFGRSRLLRLSASPSTQVIARRSKPPMNSYGLGFEEGQPMNCGELSNRGARRATRSHRLRQHPPGYA